MARWPAVAESSEERGRLRSAQVVYRLAGYLGHHCAGDFPAASAAGGDETFTAGFEDAHGANQFILKLLDSTLVPAAIQMRAGRKRPIYVDVRYEGIPAGVAAQMRQTEAMGAAQEAAQPEAWHAGEELWMRTGTACLCKFSVLPAGIAAACEQVGQLASELHLDWLAVAQATGLGLLRLEGEVEELALGVGRLRNQLEGHRGSLVLLRRPDDLRSRLEVWGEAGSALMLMRSVKRQFDPTGILNPGRFVEAFNGRAGAHTAHESAPPRNLRRRSSTRHGIG